MLKIPNDELRAELSKIREFRIVIWGDRYRRTCFFKTATIKWGPRRGTGGGRAFETSDQQKVTPCNFLSGYLSLIVYEHCGRLIITHYI